MKNSGWNIVEINSMTVYFYETGELNVSNYAKYLLRSNAILNNENNDIYCFIWSILANLHPCNIIHLNGVSNYKHCFNDLNTEGFDFTNGLKCSDVHTINELNNLSINIFELNFYQDENKWRHKLVPIENSKNSSDRVSDLATYKNPHALIKKLNVFLGDQ